MIHDDDQKIGKCTVNQVRAKDSKITTTEWAQVEAYAKRPMPASKYMLKL